MIWGILVLGSILFLLLFGIYYFFKYKKEGRSLLTERKIAILGMFLSIFIVQSYLTRFLFHNNELIPFSLDDITVISIGFLFGPLEAIFFGMVADPLRTLINGWPFQLLPFFIFPLTGLIAGIFGEYYRKAKKTSDYKNRNFLIFSFQYTIIIFLVFSFGAVFFISDEFTRINIWIFFALSIIFFLLIETIFIYKLKRDVRTDLYLLLLITWSIILSRIVSGYIIRPYSQYFYFGYDLRASIIERVFTSSYLVPSKVFFCYFFIESSFYAYALFEK